MGQSYTKPKAVQSKHYPAFFEGLPSMEGKNVVVTGCTSGTGLVCARAIARRGGSVALLNRPSERADAAFEEVKQAATTGEVVNIPCDLGSFASVREAAAKVAGAFPAGVDVLANNAGIMANKDEATVDGCDVQMQTNHLSHFLLAQQLWPLLTRAADKRGEARVVNHASIAADAAKRLEAANLGRNGGKLGGDAPGALPMTGPRWERYYQTKLANVVFTYALRDRAEAAGSKVKALVAHPGVSATNLQVTAHSTGGMSALAGKMLGFQSAEDGAMGFLRCCCDPDAKSGEYYGPAGMGLAGKAELLKERAHADAAARQMLWEESEKATGVQFKI